ncbi:polysaccharide pyruvyl transferase family protein [Cryobacterium lactosi]|uniref:Polysaccharide pyruvyl transferase family protein n=1 Tax=Cryobacterium lactosi TaxID=1259202 RepID=A0A4R9BIE3_9MICO|nr:polysaccharide pyruvyl transferase family protein [Cryobacterium lactosi]TFD83904.1 polysaccharide pyruvyl transferase family protein [Cryobacterium lactosi]
MRQAEVESEPMRRRILFCSVSAQWDNLGDIEIRQTLVDWVSEGERSVTVFVGTMPQSYIDAFAFSSNVRVVRSPIKFQVLLLRAILARRASIAFAPGPQLLGTQPKILAKTLANFANVTLVRLSGGHAIAVGRALRGSGRLAKAIERALVNKFAIYTVRDNASSSALGSALEMQPDLAFAHSGFASARKGLALISLRGDRKVDREMVKTAVEVLKGAGYDVKFVTQVKRDDNQHSELAYEFGLDAILWGSKSHLDQFDTIRAAYAEADIVISNRLHALILGIQHGAFPVAVVEPSADKLPTTLSPWIQLVSVPSVGSSAPVLETLLASGFQARKQTLSLDVDAARSRLHVLKSRVQEFL